MEEPEQEWTTRTESEELRLILATPDLAPGTRRFAMVLTDGSGIVAFPVVQVSSYKYSDGSGAVSGRDGPVEMALARYFEFPYGTRGIHVTELTFDEAGMWGVEASVPQPDGSVATIEVLMEVHEETMSVDLGEVPPLADSRTLADVEDVSDLTTGSQRDESLYQDFAWRCDSERKADGGGICESGVLHECGLWSASRGVEQFERDVWGCRGFCAC